MYGVAHAGVVALGCSPALGFIHTGNSRSFVFDIADLYKTDIAVPVAFEAASLGLADTEGHVRRAMRDKIHEEHVLERCVKDIKSLLLGTVSSYEEDPANGDENILWDGRDGGVTGGKSYVPEEMEYEA